MAVGAVAALAVCIGAVVLIPKLSNDAASGKIVTENAETPLENVSIESFADEIDSPPLDISWEYDDATGTLLVSGTGNMEDYSMETPAPWAAHKADVAMVDIDDGILSVGKNAFADFNNLTFVSLPECLETIGDNAFSGSEIRHLCYAGDEGDWAKVNVSSGNEKLFDAEFYPNSECSRARFIENSAYNTERFNCSLINYRPLVARNEGTLSLLYAGDGMELRVEHDDVYIALSGHELKESYTVNLEGSKAYQTEYSLRFMIPGRMMIEVAPSPTFTDTREIGIDDMQARLYCADAYDEESGKTKYYFVGPADLDVSYEDLTINLHFYNYYGIFYEPEEITNIDVTLYDITKDTSKQFNTITRIYSSELAENVDIPVDSTENDEHSQSAELVAYGDAGSNIAWSLDSEGVLLLEGSGDMVNYNPDSRKAPWSDYSNQIRTIRMSDGITSVGEFAFPGCENLLEVEFSKDTTRVGVMAFGNCSNLTAVKLPHGVVDVGGSSFYECTSLKDVSLPETVINIRGYAFFRCSSLESFTIPGSVTEIEAYAFYGCNKLESIFFNGTYADWRRVTVHDGNHPIINTTIGTKQN